LRVYDRGKHGKEVDKSADSDGDEGIDSNGRVDTQDEVAEPYKEQEKGNVDETWYSLSHDWHVPSVGAIMQVLSEPRALQGVAVSLGTMHIVPNPLPNEYGKECRGKTEDQSNEPESVHPDGR